MQHKKYAVLPAWRQAGHSWQIHYLEEGSGTAVVLLHPSPLSSRFMQPLVSLFAEQARAIAWDTPGYGQSDPLPHREEGLAPYVRALHDFIVQLELDRPVIYGSATGAQIAIEYAKLYPQQTRGLLLENVAWFFDAERDSILQQYFPDITPREDGSHLQQVWKMVTQLYHYFPWYQTSEDALVNTAKIPLEIVQKTVLDYLLAGADYHLAYRAAFENERPEPLQQVTVPTAILRWQDSLIKKYSDRLSDIELPDNISLHCAESGIEKRFFQLRQLLQEWL